MFTHSVLSAHNYLIIMRSMCCLTEAIDRGRYFKVESNWGDDEWGGAENYGNFTCKVGHLGQN